MDFLAANLPIFMIFVFAVLLFTGYPVAMILSGVGVAFAGFGFLLDVFPLVAFYNFPLRIYGTIANSLIFPAIPMLLFLGVSFEKSGVAEEMLLCLQVLLSRVPGRLAVAVIVLGILLGPLPGLVGASVATLALLALPTMLAQNYRVSLAAGAVAAGGTLGVIIPPSIMLVFLAFQLRIPIGHMFLGAVIPGLGLGMLYIVYYLVFCGLKPEVAPQATISAEQRPKNFLWYSIRALGLPAFLVGSVLVSIIAGWATPSQSAAVGAAAGLALMVLNRALSFRKMHEVIVTTTLMTSMVFFIVLAAGIFSYPFRYFGGDDIIANALHGLGLGDWGVFLVILGIIFVLGFFIDWLEITVITLPIFLRVMETLDFDAHVGNPELVLLWMGMLIALVLQTSFMTPPFGFALFFVKGSAPPGVELTDIYRGIVPIVAIQLLALALVLLLPGLAIWLPAKLLVGL